MARRFGARVRTLALDPTPLLVSVPFRALWIGQIVSMLGSQMRFVAIPVQVYAITGSSAAVGLVGLVEVVPLIAFSIFSGAIIDTRDRRRVLLVTQAGLFLASVGLALVSLMDEPPLVAIYALTGVASLMNAFDRPALTSMLPNLVGPELLPSALALRQVVFQTSYLVGPALGGILIATLPDISWIYAIDATTFVGASIALRWVPAQRPERAGASVSLGLVREGWAFVRRTPVLLSIFVIDLVAMVFGMPRAVFPALAERTFDAGPAVAGLLYSAPGAGALLGALTTGWVKDVRRQGRAVILSVAAWGSAVTLAGLAVFSLPLTLFFLALAGASDVVSAIFRGTMLQDATPDSLRGRVNAANIMVVTGGPRLGDFEAGIAASMVGAPGSIVVGGALCLAGTAVVATAFPALRSHVPEVRTPDR